VLLQAIDGVQRVVLLGDVLELRTGPAPEALAAALPCLYALGEALGDREVVLVAGNHDYQIVEPWVTRLAASGEADLGPEQRVEPAQASALAAELATALAPARVSVAYPGLWLAPGVYATHGHYLDRHITLPAFERLAMGAVERWLTPRGAALAGVAGYESVQAPLYAFFYALAQHRGPAGPTPTGAGSSTRAWRRLARETRRPTPRTLAALAMLRLGVAAANRAGLGPLSARLGAPELRNGVLRAMAEVVARLRIDASDVVFGHSHRSGPWPRDDAAEWAPRGVRLHNCGSWVYERHVVGAARKGSPMWPGSAIRVRAGAPPQLLDLLGDRSHDELAAALTVGAGRADGAARLSPQPGPRVRARG
jgi:hypothetical protein